MKILRRTRETRFILCSVVLVLGIGLAASFLVQMIRKREDPLEAFRQMLPEIKERMERDIGSDYKQEWTEVELKSALRVAAFELVTTDKPDLTPADMLGYSLRQMEASEARAKFEDWLNSAHLELGRREFISAYADALLLQGAGRSSALRKLEAAFQAGAHWAGSALGDALRVNRDFPAALAAYEKEGTTAEGSDARRQALELVIGQEDAEGFRRLLNLPRFRTEFESMNQGLRHDGAMLERDYAKLLRELIRGTWEGLVQHPMESGLALFCGVLWFLLLHQISGLQSRGHWLDLLAVLFGIASPVLTLFVLVLQENINKFAENGEFFNDLAYYVCGVGLREELSKLALFAPFLWWLRRKSEAQVLVTAACVGLGFAMEENVIYFTMESHSMSHGSSVLGRFISANLMHVMMTALCGLALARWVRWPRSCWQESLLTIVGMIVLHGAYDFFIANPFGIPQLETGSLSFVILLIVAIRFLQMLRRFRENRGNVLAPVFVFSVGVALLTAATIFAGTWVVGLSAVLLNVSRDILGSALLVGTFVWQLRDL